MRVSMVQALTGLAHNVLQVPDGKSFFAGQHGGDAVALHVFHGGAELAIDFFQAIKLRHVVTAERLGALGFLQNVFDQHRSLISQRLQLDGLQGDGLPALRVRRFVDSAALRMGDLAEDFETSNLVGHCSLSPVNPKTKQSCGETPGVTQVGKDRARIARLKQGWELRRSPKKRLIFVWLVWEGGRPEWNRSHTSKAPQSEPHKQTGTESYLMDVSHARSNCLTFAPSI